MQLRALNGAEAELICCDIVRLTDPGHIMEARLVRLASHYRQRALLAEDALRGLPAILARDTDAINFANEVLKSLAASAEMMAPHAPTPSGMSAATRPPADAPRDPH